MVYSVHEPTQGEIDNVSVYTPACTKYCFLSLLTDVVLYSVYARSTG